MDSQIGGFIRLIKGNPAQAAELLAQRLNHSELKELMELLQIEHRKALDKFVKANLYPVIDAKDTKDSDW